jgi:Fe-S-cluster containining protein
MPLLNEDIERIVKLGFDKSTFIYEHEGWLQLKNIDGRCFFHDGKKCTIYNNRPEGCKNYPVIFDDDTSCVRLDDDCPYSNQFELSKSIRERVVKLVSKLKRERKHMGLFVR